ncbi:MAG: hypothetical protein WCQ99_01480, partial [Pseudomonadota bacterium]
MMNLHHKKTLFLIGIMWLCMGASFNPLQNRSSAAFIPPLVSQNNINPPSSSVRLVFIHHSSGENWLSDTHGQLGLKLRENNYFVSDTNYGWGPEDLDFGSATIGDHTDIGNWHSWFRGPHSAAYMKALYDESAQHAGYSRLDENQNPGGENEVIMFKSCFPNSNFLGSPYDTIPPISDNPLRGQDASSEFHTVANARGI